MATDPKIADFLCEQMSAAGGISTRRMFGEYAVYRRGTVVALICDNQLYVKPTDAGRALLGTPTEAAPFPGAKNHFLIDALLDDAEALARLIVTTAAALPPPKLKSQAAPKAKAKGKVSAKASARAKSGTQAKANTAAKKKTAHRKPAARRS